MAREAILSIDCSRFMNDIADVIKLFNRIGWNFTGNQMEYLPFKDKDMYDWKKEQLSEDILFSVITQKQAAGEVIGVVLYEGNTGVGITFLAENTKEINLSLDVNRRKLDEEYTDSSWYVMNIVKRLEAAGCVIEHYEFREWIG